MAAPIKAANPGKQPNEWTPIYCLEHLAQLKGRSIYVKWGFTAALLHYWNGCCKPLDDDDDDVLRGICEIDQENWTKARAVIFESGKYFTRDRNGRWIFEAILPHWEKAKAIYAGKVKGGQMRGAQKHEQALSR